MIQVQALQKYLAEKQMHQDKNLSKYPEIILKMPWRSSKPNSDCGVYCMRHMETYKGQSDNWDCGFTKNNVRYYWSL